MVLEISRESQLGDYLEVISVEMAFEATVAEEVALY